MSAFTLRVEPALAEQLDRVCHEKGYKKTGLVKALIRDFLQRETGQATVKKAPQPKLTKLVGIVNLGGDAVVDAEDYFE